MAGADFVAVPFDLSQDPTDLSTGPYLLAPGRSFELRFAVPNSSRDDVRIAYDTALYPAALRTA